MEFTKTTAVLLSCLVPSSVFLTLSEMAQPVLLGVVITSWDARWAFNAENISLVIQKIMLICLAVC